MASSAADGDARLKLCLNPCYSGGLAAGDEVVLPTRDADRPTEQPPEPHRCAPLDHCWCKGARYCSDTGWCMGDPGVCKSTTTPLPIQDAAYEAEVAALRARYRCCTSRLLDEVGSTLSVSSYARCLMLCDASPWCRVLRWSPGQALPCSLVLSWSSVSTHGGSASSVVQGTAGGTSAERPSDGTEQLCTKTAVEQDTSLARPSSICGVTVRPADNVLQSRARCTYGEWRCVGNEIAVCAEAKVAAAFVANGGWNCTEEPLESPRQTQEGGRYTAVIVVICLLSALLVCCVPAAWWWRGQRWGLQGRPQMLTRQQLYQLKVAKRFASSQHGEPPGQTGTKNEHKNSDVAARRENAALMVQSTVIEVLPRQEADEHGDWSEPPAPARWDDNRALEVWSRARSKNKEPVVRTGSKSRDVIREARRPANPKVLDLPPRLCSKSPPVQEVQRHVAPRPTSASAHTCEVLRNALCDVPQQPASIICQAPSRQPKPHPQRW